MLNKLKDVLSKTIEEDPAEQLRKKSIDLNFILPKDI